MNKRIYLIAIVVLSCALLLLGAGLVGATLFLQGRTATSAEFPNPGAANGLVTPASGLLKEGDPVPELSLTTPSGEKVKLSDFQGKPVMLNFWASWCGPCTAEMKNIESVYQKHTNDDFVILAINQGEGNDTIKGYGELWKLNFRLLHDDDDQAARLYRIQALPTTVFVDAAGKVSEIHIGGPMTTEFIEKRVDDLLAKAK